MKTFWQFSQNSEQIFPKKTIHQASRLTHEIEKIVENRGFYLYEWISEEELKTSIRADYLELMISSSKIIAIFSAIIGGIGFFSKGIMGMFLGIFASMIIAYGIIFFILIVRMFRRGNLYTKISNVVITDQHFVTGGHVILHEKINETGEIFQKAENEFHEKFLGNSRISSHIEKQKITFKDELGRLVSLASNIIQQADTGGKNNPAPILAGILMMTGVCFSILLGIMYFLGLPIISIISLFFARQIHRFVRKKKFQEYQIHGLFEEIDETSQKLQNSQKSLILSLDNAKNNEWLDNLSGKIQKFFSELNTSAHISVEKNWELKKLLENSQYKNIFNFEKYEIWIRKQILEPILELLLLVEKNIAILTENIDHIEAQTRKKPWDNFWGGTKDNTLNAQKIRLEMQKKNFLEMQKILENYREKLEK